MATSSASGRATQKSGKGTPTNLQLPAGPSQLIQDLLNEKSSDLEALVSCSLRKDIISYLWSSGLITNNTKSMPRQHDSPYFPAVVVSEIKMKLEQYPKKFYEFILVLERFDLNLAAEIDKEYKARTKELGQDERASKRAGLPVTDGATPASKYSRFSDNSATCHPTVLTEEQLTEIIQELSQFNDWGLLGEKLGIPAGRLRIIINSDANSEECLRQGLLLWLQRKYEEDKHGSPTWSRLVSALMEINRALAMEIQRKYCPDEHQDTD